MAYPTVSAPYGFKPINLIGGQLFAGSTRELPIQYGYATSIFFGDWVVLSRGFTTLAQVTTATTTDLVTGVFLGCTYTDPVTKQKRFSQYWPASTLAGDALAYVADDPDQVFRAAVVSSGTALASASLAIVGQNVAGVYNAGSVNTGNAASGILAQTTTPVTTTLPFRIIDVVRDTATSITAIGSSSTTTITLTSGISAALTTGVDVAYIAANGQLIETGSYVNGAVTAGSTSVTLNQTVAVPGGVTAIPSSSTIVFTTYPEVLVKLNFGAHGYYSATSV